MRKSIRKQLKSTGLFLSMCFLGFAQWGNAQCETTNTISPTACDMYTSPSGKMFMSSGTYMDTIPNAANCDSVITINLTLNMSSTSSIVESHCASYTAPSGAVYTMSGTYMDTIANAMGCDSVITINLTINNTMSSLTEVVCSTYTAPSGAVYTTSGTYLDTIPNTNGCDSIITIDLTVNMPTSSSISVHLCDAPDYTAPDGQVYTTSGTYTAVIPNMNSCDSTITIDLTLAQSTTASMDVASCNTYTSPSGVVYNTSGTYMDTIPNMAGCDSVITINLTVNYSPIAVATVQANVNVVATPAGMLYQWIDCANGLALSSATNQIVQPMNGSYAVVVTDGNGCTDTSLCVAVTMASLDEIGAALNFEISPNPSSDFVQVQFASLDHLNLVIRDLNGKAILTKNGIVSGELLDVSGFENGVYFVELIGATHSSVQRLVKH